MKTLLVLIRDPAASNWYIDFAIGLARDLNLGIHLYYVENPANQPMASTHLSSGVALEQLQHSLKEKALLARDMLTGQVNEMMQKISGKVVVEVTSVIGNEITLINQQVNEKKAHMVMLAREGKGSSGFKHSFVEEVSRSVNCPLWIIPENTPYRKIDSVIYATDYQEEDVPTLMKVIDLTHFIAPEITALHITSNPDFELRIKNAGFQKVVQNKTGYDDITVKALVERNGMDIPEMIGDFAAQDRSNLVVVLKDNERFFERIFSSGTSHKIVRDTGYPVLVYHSADEA